MSLDSLRTCIDNFAEEAATLLEDEDFTYSAKALVFDGATVLGIVSAALTLLGTLNPVVGIGLMGLSLIGRVVSQQAMSPTERGFAQLFNARIPLPFPDRALVSIGDHVLFYDTTPSLLTFFE